MVKKFITERSEIFKYVDARRVFYKDLNRKSIFYGVSELELELYRSTIELDYEMIFRVVKEAKNHLTENRIVSNKMVSLITQKLLKVETDIALKGKYYETNKVYELKEVSKNLAFHLYAVRISGHHYDTSFNFDECFAELTKIQNPFEILTQVGYLKSLSIRQHHDKSLVNWQLELLQLKQKQILAGNSVIRQRRSIDDCRNDPDFWSSQADGAFKNKNVPGEVVNKIYFEQD